MSQSDEGIALAIFAFTYCFLAFEKFPLLRLDRVGGVLVGAVAMVLFGVLPFDEAWKAIDGPTIVLLTGMMILNVYLEESGFFQLVAARALGRVHSPAALLVGVVFLSGSLSALFLNDTVCLMLTLPLLRTLEAARLPRAPYLIALAMSANIGSVMTVVGNPQNMLIHVYSGYGYLPFLSRMLPAGLVGLAILSALLILFCRRELFSEGHRLSDQPASETTTDRPLLGLTLGTLAAVLIGFALSSNLALVAIAGAGFVLVVSRRPSHEILAKVDWMLLVFFASLFVVMAGIGKTGVVNQLSDLAMPLYGRSLAQEISVFSALTVVASNVVSNVPFVILAQGWMDTLREPDLMWLVLSMASTFAGNLTIPGSVATLIVLRMAGTGHGVSFGRFSAIGVPVTILTTLAGGALLLWLGAPARPELPSLPPR